MSTNNTLKGGLFILGILSIALVGMALANDFSTNENVGITIESHAELESVSHEYLKNESDVILTGTVTEILPSKWNTIDGKRSSKSVHDLKWHDMIYTDVVVAVDEYHKNPLNKKEVVVRIFSGTVGKDSFVLDSEPSFSLNEKVFLYLVEDNWEYTKNMGPKHYFVLGSMQGKYTLTDDGKAIRPDEVVAFEELLLPLENAEEHFVAEESK
ncbi:hypothetical protein C7960_0605 [Methanohalophilus euhalobius]|jgi:hypothetical protein|uniref:Uncharacterized protein n=1 Tax=Methanohalophilus euhalobius TaxID=51203 RepID=A0A285FW32_9EURY|nr:MULTISPECIES: hypothetical protein [Methanohalophilus]ODV49799.1 MAG: hypothetical protein A8273_851 [Methanohalophilus sp. 2-GBenrich]TCL11453.1 hypothetical protein C7960_0605 [Methanohalophilus euhalobius]SNY14516.1 hypothetical protein SAMN06295989_10436 [Methanohalophilus euhalobius]